MGPAPEGRIRLWASYTALCRARGLLPLQVQVTLVRLSRSRSSPCALDEAGATDRGSRPKTLAGFGSLLYFWGRGS